MNLDNFLTGVKPVSPSKSKSPSKSQFRQICYYSSLTNKVTWHHLQSRKDLVIKYTKKIQWRELRSEIEFATDLELPLNKNKKSRYLERPVLRIAILKSNLQKAIRRQNIESALSSAIQIYNLDPLVLVRRLSVISLEDVILLEDFPYLLFIMAAYPRMEPDLTFLLRMVESMVLSPKRDYIPDELVIEKIKSDHLISIENDHTLSDLEISLLYSLNLRAGYGGLKGDVDMITGYAQLWTKRFLGISKKKWINFLITTAPVLETEKPQFDIKFDIKFDINDILLESVDFHTCPGMLKELMQHILGIEAAKLKKIIWYCRSGINSRGQDKSYVISQKKYQRIYLKIEALLKRYSQRKIKEAFNNGILPKNS